MPVGPPPERISPKVIFWERMTAIEATAAGRGNRVRRLLIASTRLRPSAAEVDSVSGIEFQRFDIRQTAAGAPAQHYSTLPSTFTRAPQLGACDLPRPGRARL